MQSLDTHGRLVWSSRDNDSAHRGRDRKGIRAGDLVREARYDNDISNPRVEIPYVLTKGKTFRVIEGAEVPDRLTAADQALWFYLFARAKADINSLDKVGGDGGLRDREAYAGERRVHGVAVGDMLAYLGIANPARLRESLERIGETEVRYDIRYRRTRLTRPVRYLSIHSMPDKLRSRDLIRYEIDPEVRVCMLLSRTYVPIDLNALTRFKSRYTVRLFQLLSQMASRHSALLESKRNKQGKVGLNRRHWAPSPQELATRLGYPMATFRAPTFLAAMEKVITDLDALAALHKRFDFVAARPTERLPAYAFAVTEARKAMFDGARAWLGGAAFFHASAHTRPGHRPGIKMTDGQFVRLTRIAQAQAYTHQDGLKISKAWRADVEAANRGTGDEIAGWQPDDFLARIERFGPEAVFEAWVIRKATIWNTPVEDFGPAAVPEHEAITYDGEEEEDLRIGDELGDMGNYDYDYSEAA
ncbi:replication initiation protein [Rhizobium sp. Leaf383]|uniref:replication initiation protein n=1 Tax=Rhizobium sp. Leaf383 TaxID=1736357 RepID=UPI000712F3B7|nr:replication initiation protein [Rhizobium sp. Leaf383]KQS84846.1 hypothetical protein ASG58_20350 [Rhizobium sp. Leaf383]